MKKEEINYEYYGSYSFPKWISRLVIPVAIMVILSLVLIDATHKRTANSLTSGMQPEEVVHSFFSGINQNDLALVWDCIDHKKINPLSHPLLSYSFNAQRRHLEDAYHGHAQLQEGEITFTPIEWEEKGKPQLRYEQRLEGIGPVELSLIEPNRYKAIYDFYFTVYNSTFTEKVVKKQYMEDEIILVETKGSWKISEILHSEKEAIEIRF